MTYWFLFSFFIILISIFYNQLDSIRTKEGNSMGLNDWGSKKPYSRQEGLKSGAHAYCIYSSFIFSPRGLSWSSFSSITLCLWVMPSGIFLALPNSSNVVRFLHLQKLKKKSPRNKNLCPHGAYILTGRHKQYTIDSIKYVIRRCHSAKGIWYAGRAGCSISG